jgi:hypothetical protein
MSRPTDTELNHFYSKLDAIPALQGAGVAYVGDSSCEVLRRDFHTSGLDTYVIIDEEDALPGQPAPSAVAPPDIKVELVGLGLNCGGAVLSWAALGAEGAAAPVSGGTSLGLTILTWSAALATSAQCANSILRSADVFVHDGEWAAWLDSLEFYNWAMDALDVVSVAGAAAAGAATVRAALAVRRATGRSFVDILRSLSRAERKRLTRELIQMQKPGISNQAMKTLIRAGTFPARFSAAQISQGLFGELRDAISATMAFGSSAVSGTIKVIFVHIYQE